LISLQKYDKYHSKVIFNAKKPQSLLKVLIALLFKLYTT